MSTFRNTAIGAVAIGLALTSSARATWLADYNSTGFVHVQFEIPTFLTSDTTSTFTLDVGAVVTSFEYALPGSGGACSLGLGASAPCDGIQTGASTTVSVLNSTGNPDVFTDFVSGTLAFTQLAAAVPEPASLPLLVMGLAGLGLVVRRRRA